MSDISERPEILRVEDAPLPPEVRRRVAELLASGGVVCLPTESVYGLAVRADRAEALQALRRAKGEPDQRAYTWHVADLAVLQRFPELSAVVRRLAERYWPGPLTLVLDGVPEGLERVAAGGSIGVRFPAHAATHDLLAALPFPVVMTSANRAGATPATSVASLDSQLLPHLAAIVDAGRARLGEPSAILRVGRGKFDLLREGLVGLAELRRTAGLRLGFCCTGNTCRSPMAEGLATVQLRARLGCGEAGATARELVDYGFTVESMGILASVGAPASAHAVEILQKRGIDLSGHRSRRAVPERIRQLDRVYCLTAAHREALVQGLPPGAAVHLELLDPGGRDVPDPIGGSREAYRECAAVLEAAIEQRACEWV